MRSFFKVHVGSLQFSLILVGYGTPIGNKYLVTLRLRKKGGSCSAFTCAQYGYALLHLSFSVANVTIASSIPTIQNRVTILDSCKFFF